jgi:hypothetical protein
VAIDEREYETMRYRARSFRRRVDELGGLNAPAIEGNVRDRLRWRETTSLPSAQGELADEIVALLGTPKLSPHQAAHLEREFFGP